MKVKIFVSNVVLYDLEEPGILGVPSRIVRDTGIDLFKIIRNINTFRGHSAEVMNAISVTCLS